MARSFDERAIFFGPGKAPSDSADRALVLVVRTYALSFRHAPTGAFPRDIARSLWLPHLAPRARARPGDGWTGPGPRLCRSRTQRRGHGGVLSFQFGPNQPGH